MDTSASKALIMVASVLLAMMVIAFITVSFNRVGTWAGTENEQQEAEQREAFNKEFEAYDKRLMYGLDVISCLNKIVDNNSKITTPGRVNGNQYDTGYEVQATLNLKRTTLEESITVYHMERNRTTSKENEIAYRDNNNANGLGTLGSISRRNHR